MGRVDNNPTRVLASRYFRHRGDPVIFTAVSADGDHGYVFAQEAHVARIVDSVLYPRSGAPAILDILQAVGALVAYAVDSVLMGRPRSWKYRRIGLSNGGSDGVIRSAVREEHRRRVQGGSGVAFEEALLTTL